MKFHACDVVFEFELHRRDLPCVIANKSIQQFVRPTFLLLEFSCFFLFFFSIVAQTAEKQIRPRNTLATDTKTF